MQNRWLQEGHHTILHPPNPPAINPPTTNITTGTEVHSQNVIDQYRSNRAHVQIIPAKLMNNDIFLETNVLLDTGLILLSSAATLQQNYSSKEKIEN